MNAPVLTSQKRPTILLVEDRADDRMMFKTILEASGNAVVTVMGVSEVIQKALEGPDLILMDIGLDPDKPDGVEGIDLVRQIKALGCDVPVIYLTIASDEQTFRIAEDTDPYGYVLKSSGEQILPLVIRNVLRRFCAEKELAQTQFRSAQLALAKAVIHDLNKLMQIVTASQATLTAALQDASDLSRSILSESLVGQTEEIDLNKLLAQYIPSLRMHVNAKTTIRFMEAGSLPLISCDPVRMRRIVLIDTRIIE